MLAASLMEWYLQTRTNTSINYKTILPLEAPPTTPIPRASSLPLSTLPPSRQSIATSLFLPLFLHVDDELLITRIPRVISRTIVPSPGLRKYLTLEGLDRKEKDAVFRTRPSRMTAVDGNGNRGTKRRWIQSWIGGVERRGRSRRGRGGGGKNRGWRRLEVRWRLISPKSTERQILERNVAG